MKWPFCRGLNNPSDTGYTETNQKEFTPLGASRKVKGLLWFRNSNSSACVVGMSTGSPVGATK